MSSQKKMIADLLFGVQIIGAVIFCGAYILRSFFDVTGSSVAQFGSVVAFLVFSFALAIGAHRAAPSRLTRQTLATYLVWLVLLLTLIGVVSINPAYHWNDKDTQTLVTALILTVGVIAVSRMKGLPFDDPMIKAFLAIAYKAVPQVLLAVKFLAEGASGTPGLSVILGHATILIRLGQIYFLVLEAGWDRNRIWMAINETANEASWIVASIAWLIVM